MSNHDHAGERLLNAYLETNGIDATIVAPRVPMPTVPLAAAAIGVTEDQIVKSVLFSAKDGRVVLAIACGTARIDRDRLAQVLGMPRLKLADPETVFRQTGYPAGGVAPIGHANPVPVVIDHRVLAQSIVYGGAGSEEALLRIAPDTICALTTATIADITVPAEPA